MSTASEWLDAYLARFEVHHEASENPDGEEMAALLGCFSPDARYYDIPTGGFWEGREAIKEMFLGGYRFGDNEKHILSRFTDGTHFGYECESIGSNKLPIGTPGVRWVVYSCSVGTFDEHGLITEQRDYWDRKGWATQVGLEQPLDWSSMTYPEGDAASGSA